MKRENTVRRTLKNRIFLGEHEVVEIYFDLNHINYGWDSVLRGYNPAPPRQNFSEDDIVSFFEQLATLSNDPICCEIKLKSVRERFVFYIYDQKKKMRMVVDIMKSNATVVVTIY